MPPSRAEFIIVVVFAAVLSNAQRCSCFLFTETFELVLRGRGFPRGRGDQGVVCSFVVNQKTIRKNQK